MQRKPLIAYSPALKEQIVLLKKFLLDNLYRHQRVYRMTVKAQRVVTQLFEALWDDLRLLPPELYAQTQESRDKAHRARVVADYIAGMTDRYALDEHERLFDPRRLR